ncbi:hypothetical protein BKA82DRAFT_1000681 [Pisolithus tinctorius]|uniref:Uncharacterized protein n=1 Tax=Pisolithus tinctorius Marx 270 TaxID=870435 RepID=A0A0C3NTE5_PISTI|nr:hypothetical protein BKA82DRAFT_1000681 [Pisolithus tinctorius]KIO04165.1 hypothetical protein M404DRAFT_1000681 [Pisolithus tinctorius Marx 270]
MQNYTGRIVECGFLLPFNVYVYINIRVSDSLQLTRFQTIDEHEGMSVFIVLPWAGYRYLNTIEVRGKDGRMHVSFIAAVGRR